MGRRRNKLPDTGPPPLKVWSREQWNALPPVEASPPLEHPIHYLSFTHTQTAPCKKHEDCVRILQDLQKKHIQQGMTDIQFHWMVGGDGNAYEGRGWHTKTVNTEPKDLFFQGKTLNVAFIGNYPDRYPPEEIFITAGALLKPGFENNTFHPDCVFVLHHIEKPEKQIKQEKQPKKLEEKKKSMEERIKEEEERQSSFYNIRCPNQTTLDEDDEVFNR